VEFQPVIATVQVDRQEVGHPGQAPVQGGPVDAQQRRGLLGVRATVQVGPDRGLVDRGALGQQRGYAAADPLRCRPVARQGLENGIAAQLAPVRGPAERRNGGGDLGRVAGTVQLGGNRLQGRGGAGRAGGQLRPGQGADRITQMYQGEDSDLRPTREVVS
jgi:hypothetical protein